MAIRVKFIFLEVLQKLPKLFWN